MTPELTSSGVLRPLDVQFARMLGRVCGEAQAPEDRQAVLLAAALASRAPSLQHTCIDLRSVREDLIATALEPLQQRARRGQGAGDDEDAVLTANQVALPQAEAWVAAVAASPAVFHWRSAADDAALAGGRRPLVLWGYRLYLYRYWAYQRRLARDLVARAEQIPAAWDDDVLQAELDRLFVPVPAGPSGAGTEGPDLQRAAAESAAKHRLTLISGGPGTGKTTTVKRLLVLLLRLHQRSFGEGEAPALRWALMAPTGKAAGRLQEAIGEELEALDLTPEELAALPRTASTVHRMLGLTPDDPRPFRHHRDRPLPVDVVVVDEASMVDLALMTKIFDAIPAGARVVLLGDRDQLLSVEAGAVLGDICRAALPVQTEAVGPDGRPLPPDTLAPPSPLTPVMVHLTRTHRFGPDSGIGALARAVNAGDSGLALAYLRSDRVEAGSSKRQYRDLRWIDLPTGSEEAARAPGGAGRADSRAGFGPLSAGPAACAGGAAGAGAAGTGAVPHPGRPQPRGLMACGAEQGVRALADGPRLDRARPGRWPPFLRRSPSADSPEQPTAGPAQWRRWGAGV